MIVLIIFRFGYTLKIQRKQIPYTLLNARLTLNGQYPGKFMTFYMLGLVCLSIHLTFMP